MTNGGKSMNKKILIGSIIATILLTIPISVAVDTDITIDDILLDNSDEIGASDEYKEIITSIDAWGAEGTIEVDVSGIGIFFHRVEIWADESIEITGIRRFHIFPVSFSSYTHHLIAPRRVILFHGGISPGQEQLHAIALGNIEWS